MQEQTPKKEAPKKLRQAASTKAKKKAEPLAATPTATATATATQTATQTQKPSKAFGDAASEGYSALEPIFG
eukprot:scaffold1726_cov260-Pinguiococcus_pyrenoidosus.AAC.27